MFVIHITLFYARIAQRIFVLLARGFLAHSFADGRITSLQTSLCVKYLVGRPVEAGTVYYFDLLNLEYETIPFL